MSQVYDDCSPQAIDAPFRTPAAAAETLGQTMVDPGVVWINGCPIRMSRKGRDQLIASGLLRAAMEDPDWAFRARFRTLPPRYREVIRLRCQQGLSRKQIAERLAAPEETVRSRMNRALAVLMPDLTTAQRSAVSGSPLVCYRYGKMIQRGWLGED